MFESTGITRISSVKDDEKNICKEGMISQTSPNANSILRFTEIYSTM